MSAYRNDLNPKKLLALSDEVGRLATTLARLSTDPGIASPDRNEITEGPEITARELGSIVRARRLRSRFFDEEHFADPAWDMMLELFHAELCQRRVAVSSLCIAAAVPATTALRWLKALTEKGLFIRHCDPFDGRRIYVELAPETSNALREYFRKIGGAPVI